MCQICESPHRNSVRAPLLASPQHPRANQTRGAPPPSISKPCMAQQRPPCPRAWAFNHAPGAVVTLMERSNVSTVMCAGQIKKRRGAIVGYDIPKLRAELDASRDYVFAAGGIERDLFRA